MTLTIRSASVDESHAISALIIDCIRRTNVRDYPADVIELTCQNFTPERVLTKMQQRDTFVAFNNEVLVATVGFSGTTLHTLFVSPDEQRKRIGRELVSFVEERMLANGVYLIDVHASITARNFYRHLGYDEILFEEKMDGSTFLMRKVLPPL
jgi:GNAT superfamily N-acetyltransferase